MVEWEKRKIVTEGKHIFLEAQEGRCCLCGDDTWDDPDPNSYFAPTWDHVIPEARGGKLFGNMLVAHNGCNSRKAKALPTEAEQAILKIVNAKLGWDGVVYRVIEGDLKYRNLGFAERRNGLAYVIGKYHPTTVKNYLLWKEGIFPSDIKFPEPTFFTGVRKPKTRPHQSKNVLVKQRDRITHRLIRKASSQ